MTADAASGFAKSGKVAPVNHKLLDRCDAVDQKSKNTAPETATNKSTTKAVKLLRTVKNRSLKTDIWESTPHVTKLKPKPKDKREVPTKVIGSKDELISMSSTPEKCDTESTALNAEKTFSDSKAPIPLSKELYANKVEEVQTNIQNKQMILYYQKTKLQIDTLIKLCDGLKSDLTVAQTSQKCDSILIGSSSELGNNSKNFGLLKVEQSIDAKSKKLKHLEKDGEEDCGKLQFSVKETKLPASKDISSEVPTSIFMDSNVADNEDGPSTNHELNVRNSSKIQTTRSENNSQSSILSDCNNIKGNTPAFRSFNRHEKSAGVSDIQDCQQTVKPPSKRIKDYKDVLSEMLRIDEFQLTPNYSPGAPASKGFWNVQLKDDSENNQKEA
ncbi:hypothetical protein RF11_09542 [Thelohanellus kitauei]|uniref:Uncharacterized protein n=1 Tax=Thelohanellus kitauei TaxID=669202 RepID=A0A0C2N476_THEKT|nr:hypothetical protein RF11_09542 [Thelohanellus kitauei]